VGIEKGGGSLGGGELGVDSGEGGGSGGGGDSGIAPSYSGA